MLTGVGKPLVLGSLGSGSVYIITHDISGGGPSLMRTGLVFVSICLRFICLRPSDIAVPALWRLDSLNLLPPID